MPIFIWFFHIKQGIYPLLIFVQQSSYVDFYFQTRDYSFFKYLFNGSNQLSWLLLKNQDQKALSVLKKVRSSQQEIEEEVREIKESIASNQGVGFNMLSKGFFWKILIMGVILQMFQQLVGINMMIYYAPTIFGYAGMTGLIALLAIPTVNMLFTFPAIKWIEKWGRKKLLYVEIK